VRQPYPTAYTEDDLEIVDLDCSIIAPTDMHESLCDALVQDLGDLFPGIDVNFKILEDSGSDARVYVLLVAHSASGHRWGRDVLTSIPKRQSKSASKANGKKGNSNNGGNGSSCISGAKATVSVSQSIARKVSKELFAEVSNGGVVDEFLQDQIVIFQALAEGFSSFPGPRSALAAAETTGTNNGVSHGKADLTKQMAHLSLHKTGKSEVALRRDNAGQPFGQGSDHTTTARWVASMLLPQLNFFNKGLVCQGIGISMQRPLGQDPNA